MSDHPRPRGEAWFWLAALTLAASATALLTARQFPDRSRFLELGSVLLLAGGVLMAAWRARRAAAWRGPPRGPLAFLLCAALLLAGAISLLPAEARSGLRPGLTQSQMAAMGQEVRSRWAGLLQGLDSAASLPPSLLARIAVGSPEEAFEQLETWSESRRVAGLPPAITVFTREGTPLAWTGPVRDLSAPSAGTARFQHVRVGTTDLLECWRGLREGSVQGARVEFLASARPGTKRSPIETALGLDSELHRGEISFDGLEPGNPGDLVFGLEDADGVALASCRLTPPAVSLLHRRLGTLLVLLPAAAALALAAAGFLLAQAGGNRPGPGAAHAGLLILLLFPVRLGLSGVLRLGSDPGMLAGPQIFAVPAPFGLLASPLDLFLSALFLLACALLAAASFRAAGQAEALQRWSRSMAVSRALLLVAGLAGTWWAVRAVHALPLVCRINPIRFQLLDPEPARLALQGASLLLVATPLALLLAGAFGSVAPPSRGRSGLALLVLAAAASAAALIAGGERASARLIESNLAGEAAGLESRHHKILEETLERLGSAALVDESDSGAAGGEGPSLAFNCWAATRLAVDGLRSSVAVLDEVGRLRSEFTFNLPPGAYKSSPASPQPDSPPTIRPDEYRLLTLRIPLLRGEAPLRGEGRAVGRLVIQLSEEPDNVPFLTRNDPLVALLDAGGRDPIYDEFLGGDPLLVVYASDGEVLHSSAPRPPALGPGLRSKLSSSGTWWRRADVGGRSHWLYYFPTQNGQVAAIGYPAGGWGERISAFVRFVLLALAGFVLGRALLRLALSPRAALRAMTLGWIESVRRSYSTRLLVALLVASMLPLLGLSAYLRAQVRERTTAETEMAGVAALETARRLVEDYIESAAPPAEGLSLAAAPAPPIGSDALFWLSRVVRQDLTVFVEGRLAASSRPEFYEAGLLSPCLDGDVARQVLHRRAPYVLKEQPLGAERALFIYAPVGLPYGTETAVLAMPLTTPQRELRHASNTLGEGLLTVSALLGALLAAIAVVTSRRISGPIKLLTRGAARVADGDYGVRLPVKTLDETGRMMDSFNTMARALEGQREDLRRRADYIEKILLNATAGVISADPNGHIRTINPAARLLLRLEGEVEGRRLIEILRSQARLRPLAVMLEGLDASGHEKLEQEVDLPEGGEQRRLRCVVLPLREQEEGPPGRMVLLEDLTEIVRSNRLSAWAEMARSIAHEIKNPLTPIQLSAEHLLRIHREGDPSFDAILQECVRTILVQVRALREISGEFSAYARLPALQLRPTDPVELLRDLLGPYRSSPPTGTRVEEQYGAVAPVPLDERVLRRALVNLIENALQAMPEGGVLSVRADPLPSGGVTIEIADSGEGMDEATLGRIFEPYFSTREAGTGMGLAIARRAVEAHGGSLSARSQRGRGTVMTITLPAEPPSPPAPPAA